MQRTMKKTFSFVLALALVFSMCIGMFSTQAQAADNNTLVIAEENEGFSFSAYQIFSGTYTKGEGDEGDVLSDIDWGSGIDTSKLASQVNAINTLLGTSLSAETIVTQAGAQAIAEALGNVDDYSSTASQFASIMGNCLSSTSSSMTGPSDWEGTTGYGVSGLADGYYLIKTDEVPTLSDGTTGAYTEYILAIVGGDDVTVVEEKEDIPQSDKKTGDVNDSDPTNTDPNYNIPSDEGTSGDYDIGDHVPFTLTGTVSSYYKDFVADENGYCTVFHDTMTDGLSFDEDSVNVYIVINGESVPVDLDTYSDYVTLITSPTDTCSFEVAFTDFAGLLDELGYGETFNANSDYIKITFTAELTSDALIGNATDNDTAAGGLYGSDKYGNMNKSHLTYSNDVYNGDHTGSTPDVSVRIYTYGFTVNKTDPEGNELTGAAFTLEKFVAGEGDYTLIVDGQSVTGSWVPVEMDKYDGEEGTQTEFDWTGIDDGYYRISETEPPAGYNSIDDVYFIVTATHSVNSTTLTIYDATYAARGNNAGTLTKGDVSTGIYVDQSTGATGGNIVTNVENEKGSTLPSTGGIGTTIFYIVGAGIVLCAVVVLVTRRRMRRAA